MRNYAFLLVLFANVYRCIHGFRRHFLPVASVFGGNTRIFPASTQLPSIKSANEKSSRVTYDDDYYVEELNGDDYEGDEEGNEFEFIEGGMRNRRDVNE